RPPPCGRSRDRRSVPDGAKPADLPRVAEGRSGAVQRQGALPLDGVRNEFDVDITETIETKFEALRQHESQFENFEEMAGRVREFWRNDKGGYTERFRRIQLLF